jgi:beta-lactamase regulating signal transducer with metallopeptidase domain
MILMLQSALRALLLGACVWSLLRLLRLRDARTETALWTLVLLAALAMPLLTPWAEARLPAFNLPAQAPILAQTAGRRDTSDAWSRLFAHAALFWALYLAVAAVLLARLAVGVALGFRLWRRATALAPGLRLSPALRSPMVFGRCILLPPEWLDWQEVRRDAVLAHEQCHVARGDFFLQLGAGVYRALFWFSPFSWWLLRELCVLAESASDAAAVRRMGDRASYAELLVDVARQAQNLPALVAMAKGPDIAWRVERILDEGATERTLSAGMRAVAVIAVLAAGLGFAGAHVGSRAAAATTAPAAKATKLAKSAPMPVETVAPTPRPAHAKSLSGPLYDPRALLRDPAAVMVRGLIVTTNG